MARETAKAVLEWTEEGRLPLVVDATSCTHGLLQDVAPELEDDLRERFDRVQVMDAVAWAHDRLLPNLTVSRRLRRAVVHPTCSAGHLRLQEKLEALLSTLADDVHVPPGTTCCGMAGDRGFLHPELPASALRDVRAELQGAEADAFVSSNRTCEIALQRETGRPYGSFVLLLEELTRAG
jgi:D-lactate dehydrogenase